jgi:hypothetical protein
LEWRLGVAALSFRVHERIEILGGFVKTVGLPQRIQTQAECNRRTRAAMINLAERKKRLRVSIFNVGLE